MAWEELLKTRESREEDSPAAAREELRDRESLIRQAAAMIGQGGEEVPAPEENGEPGEAVCCRDGYVRRSPVQRYGTAADYHARRIRRALMIVGGICAAALLALALVRVRLIRF
jgi:hypothetical protein